MPASLRLFLLSILVGCCLVGGLLLAVPADAAPCRRAAQRQTRDALVAYVRKYMKLPSKHHHLKISFAKRALPIAKYGFLDVQTGVGHGHYLSFWRMRWRGDRVSYEWIQQAGGRTTQPRIELRRTRSSLKPIVPLLCAVQAVAALRLRVIHRPPPPTKSRWVLVGSAVSSADFFSLVRLGQRVDKQDKVQWKRAFAGYGGGVSAQKKYIGIGYITKLAEDLFSSYDPKRSQKRWKWKIPKPSQWRQSHFTDAYMRLRPKLIKNDFWWWVMEYGLDFLPAVGNMRVLPTIRAIRTNNKKLLPRQKKLLDKILKRPTHWLKGKHKGRLSK